MLLTVVDIEGISGLIICSADCHVKLYYCVAGVAGAYCNRFFCGIKFEPVRTICC